jgi:predicted transposase YdaD
MATPYDDTLKIFVSENAQDFISWLVKGARVKDKLSPEFEGRKLQADALIVVVLPDGAEMLVEIEFQADNDPTMPERLLEYNLRARREHKRAVLSCVIYLRNDGNVPQSPLSWKLPGGQEVLRFHYQSIELAKITPNELRQTRLSGLLPLLFLTKGGATHEIAEEVFTELENTGKIDLIPPAYTLASLGFGKENQAEQDWLIRRLSKMHDILRDTPVYQEMTRLAREEGLQEGREEGLQEGREEGREEGLQEGLHELRQTVLDVVLERFPKIVRLAKEQVAGVEEPAILRHLIVKISIAQTAKEAKQYLLEVDEDEDDE